MFSLPETGRKIEFLIRNVKRHRNELEASQKSDFEPPDKRKKRKKNKKQKKKREKTKEKKKEKKRKKEHN